jgi:homoserine dehydrogenase
VGAPSIAPSPPRRRAAVPAAPAPLRVVVAGCGTVGRALLRAAAPFAAAGEIRIVAIADRAGTVHDPRGIDPAAAAAAKEAGGLARLGLPVLPLDGAAAAAALPADAVLDLVAGDLDARSPDAFPTAAALAAGRDAVAANKAPLALFPAEVAARARRAGARVLASAAVAGAVPILEVLGGALRGAGLLEVAGAWNATSTFVLSRVEEGATPEEALVEARRRGFAEEDASADLDGRDAAAKAVIVAAAAFGLPLRLDRVARSGIASLDPERLREAGRRGRRTRLVARVDARGARVAPEVLPEDHPLAAAAGEAAVLVRTALAGTVALRGPGAGGPATASAVLNDLLALARGPRRAP